MADPVEPSSSALPCSLDHPFPRTAGREPVRHARPGHQWEGPKGVATLLRVWLGLLGSPGVLRGLWRPGPNRGRHQRKAGLCLQVPARGLTLSRGPWRCISRTDQRPTIHSLLGLPLWAGGGDTERPTHGVPFSPQPRVGSSPNQGGHRQVPPGALQSALPLPVWLCPTPFLGHALSRGTLEPHQGSSTFSPFTPGPPRAQARDAGTRPCPPVLHRGGGEAPRRTAQWGEAVGLTRKCPWRLPVVCTGASASARAGPAHLWPGGHRPGWLGFRFYFGGKRSHMRASCSPPFLSPSGSQQGFFLFAQLGLGLEREPQPLAGEEWKEEGPSSLGQHGRRFPSRRTGVGGPRAGLAGSPGCHARVTLGSPLAPQTLLVSFHSLGCDRPPVWWLEGRD